MANMELMMGLAVTALIVSFFIAYKRFIFMKQSIFAGILFAVFIILYFVKGYIARHYPLEQAGILFAVVLRFIDTLYFKYLMAPLCLLYSIVKSD